MSAPEPSICGTHSCGNHGTCNPTTLRCDCVDGWSGTRCTIGPPAGTACRPSDQAFRDQFAGGDLSCGNLGVYGKCQPNGLCACPPHTNGKRCQYACDATGDVSKQCGGLSRGKCNADGYGQCTCVNGWTGPQCQTPPPGACTTDADCGWGGTHGTCDVATGTCLCLDGFYGERCERARATPGQSCDVDADCTQPTCADDYYCTTSLNMCCPTDADAAKTCGVAKCDPVTHTCSVTGATSVSECEDGSHADPAAVSERIQQIVDALLSPEGLAYLLVNSATRETVELVVETLATAPYRAYLSTQISQMVGSLADRDMAAALAQEVASQTTANIVARAAAENAARESVDAAVEAASVAVRGVLGSVMDIVDAAGIIGLLLDGSDVAGFSAQLNQDYLDVYALKVLEAYNTNPAMVDAGVTYPFEVNAQWGVDYQTEALSKQRSEDMVRYANAYLRALRVNSEGQPIQFAAGSQVSTDADARHHANALNSVLWGLSGGNEDVFARLLDYWWLALLVLIVALALLVVPLAVYGAKEHKRARAMPT